MVGLDIRAIKLGQHDVDGRVRSPPAQGGIEQRTADALAATGRAHNEVLEECGTTNRLDHRGPEHPLVGNRYKRFDPVFVLFEESGLLEQFARAK